MRLRVRPGHRPGPVRLAGDAAIAGGFRVYLAEFLEWMRAMHFSGHTIKNRRIDLGYFIAWCEERSVQRPDDVTRALLERYRQAVFNHRRQDKGEHQGQPLSFQTQGKRLIAVRVFFQWLARQHYLLYNPASELDLPRPEKRLPRHVLTVAEVDQVLNAIDSNNESGLGVRDRAMLETLYSTGMRRGELVALRLDDVDLERGTLLIRQGKGNKDRVVPIGARACRWIEKYVHQVRADYLDHLQSDAGVLFLATHGDALQGKQLSGIVKKTIETADLECFRSTHPNAACHLLRHACATHMLEGGADIRYIQQLLGHAALTTTAMYTQVSIQQLKAVHEKTHPARLKPLQHAIDDNTKIDTSAAGEATADAPQRSPAGHGPC